MLRPPRVNSWGSTISSTADGTRPVAAMGVSVTPAQNAYGSYVTLISGANLVDDCWLFELCVNTVGISATARDCVCSIGLDPAGGTSFTSIVDLVCGPASGYQVSGGALAGGVWFRFPYMIKAGTSIGIAAAVNSATLTAIAAFLRTRGRPTRPDLVSAGTYIDQYGVTLASSSGTGITPGTTSEGAYTAIGSTTTRPLWYVEYGYGINNGTMQNGGIDVDVAYGDATNKQIAIQNACVFNSANEVISKSSFGQYAEVATGQQFYARSQAGGTLETGHSVAVYGVGG